MSVTHPPKNIPQQPIDEHHRLHPPALLQRHAELLVQVGRQERDQEHPADVHAELHRAVEPHVPGPGQQPEPLEKRRPGLRGPPAARASPRPRPLPDSRGDGFGRPVADDEPEQRRDHQPAQAVEDEHAAPVTPDGLSGHAAQPDADERGREGRGQARGDRPADPPAERDRTN